MEMFWRLSPWISRLFLLAGTVILTLVGTRFVLDPSGATAEFGITLGSPLAMTNMRVGFGAFPLSGAIAAALCLASTQRLRLGLAFTTLVFGVALLVRAVATVIDHTLGQSVTLLIAESVLTGLSLLGVAIETGRFQRQTP